MGSSQRAKKSTVQPGSASFLTVYFNINLLKMGECGQELNNYVSFVILHCSWPFWFHFFWSRTNEVNWLCVTLWPQRQWRHSFLQRKTEGAKNASTEEAGTLNHQWGTDLYITLNIKRQYLASVSQTSDSAERGDNDRASFSGAEQLSPAINGSSVPSITYFWLVGD